MSSHPLSVPTPTLRILPTSALYPHESHDFQRATPLIERLKQAEFLTNPPIVAPIDQERYVVLDGANRYHALKTLGYPFILAQVAPYDSGFVELHVWQHVVSNWSQEAFLDALTQLPQLQLKHGWDSHAMARILFRDGVVVSLDTPADDLVERNTLLCQIVSLYQANARLDRTALEETSQVWDVYPSASAIVRFPPYAPHDILKAAKERAFIPPGISRHIIHGRALQLNYPLSQLKNTEETLAEKNFALQDWIRRKFAQRAVRFYAESTYQFNE
jgi:hypothetical protein